MRTTYYLDLHGQTPRDTVLSMTCLVQKRNFATCSFCIGQCTPSSLIFRGPVLLLLGIQIVPGLDRAAWAHLRLLLNA